MERRQMASLCAVWTGVDMDRRSEGEKTVGVVVVRPLQGVSE